MSVAPFKAKPISDRRASLRQRRLHAAKIVFNNGTSTIDCIVRDQSATGARLDVASPIGIPDWFDLQINRSGVRYPSKVAWRSGKQIGVMFLNF
jgi:PilZ domain